jgi:hypothetical protein
VSDEQRHQRSLDYAKPPDVRISPIEILFCVIALLCGVVLLFLAAVFAIFNFRTSSTLSLTLIPVFIMSAAGGAGCFIGIRALRRWRHVRGD